MKILFLSVVVLFASCKSRDAVRSDANLEGIGGSADGNTVGGRYLYTYQSPNIYKWRCPATGPIAKGLCTGGLGNKNFVSFERELSSDIDADIAKIKSTIAGLKEAETEISMAIPSADATDAESLKEQLQQIKVAIENESQKLPKLESQRTGLTDTLAQLKSAVDIQIDLNAELFEDHRPVYFRFHNAFSDASQTVTLTTYGCKTQNGSIRLGSVCEHLKTVTSLFLERCDASTRCNSKQVTKETGALLKLFQSFPSYYDGMKTFKIDAELYNATALAAIAVCGRSWKNVVNRSELALWVRVSNTAVTEFAKLQNHMSPKPSSIKTCKLVLH